MKKTIIKSSLLISVIIFLMIVTSISTTQVHAQDDRRVAAKDVSVKLAGIQLSACQNRQESIKNIMSRIADRGQKQVDLFNTIAERTENFYDNTGKILSNYENLVADVADKKASAQIVLDEIKFTTFDCKSDNPKGIINGFKDNLKNVIKALQTFKTSVKDLIVGVKSVQSVTSSENREQ